MVTGIQEPTHYTENSQSILDLILVNKPESVLFCGVGEPVLEQNIKYHCPIFAIFTFYKPNISSFKRHMWFYDRGNYNDFRQHLSNTDWDSLKNDDINVWVTHFTNYLLDTCTQQSCYCQTK